MQEEPYVFSVLVALVGRDIVVTAENTDFEVFVAWVRRDLVAWVSKDIVVAVGDMDSEVFVSLVGRDIVVAVKDTALGVLMA
jgi:hypothetical protein